jgi:hypothetical protein
MDCASFVYVYVCVFVSAFTGVVKRVTIKKKNHIFIVDFFFFFLLSFYHMEGAILHTRNR